jgi:hypothetical protein
MGHTIEQQLLFREKNSVSDYWNKWLKVTQNWLFQEKITLYTLVLFSYISWNSCGLSVSPGIKKWVYCLSQSQKNCTEKPGLIGILVTQICLVGRCETQLGPHKCVLLTICYPPSWLTFLICGERYCKYIYWVLRNNSSVHSVAFTQTCDTLLLTSSSSSSSATSSHIFFLPWERVSRTFLGYHHASFLTRSLCFLELFSDSLFSVFGHLLWGPASCLAITRTVWSEWTRAWWCQLCYLNFECLWPPLLMSSLPSDCP